MQCGGKLDAETTPCTFDLEDLSDSEDIWIMDIPRLVSHEYNFTERVIKIFQIMNFNKSSIIIDRSARALRSSNNFW